ncbi:tryptophan 2,3-dioxygenase [Catenuloplanes nepalensis]|uniref:Tryptophan 2,3-dioxygenase n=1 Tax=Catenuloplanes nepalensis TaxID=587533 RepID=A0ABT9MME8_9ACTN|nr:tryptophan 2,3-dioxygenase family protein [Catenuloplanes nepalensis]MDP9792559.1 tryptophan 2,3-dioxygenase [Catenuloplanes nepalensis]
MSSERARPVLPGTGTTDYARYMRTETLLTLQRDATEWIHPDELLFQVTHQAHELLLKAAAHSLARAVTQMDIRRPVPAQLLVQRAALVLRLLTGQLRLLRTISPVDFAQIRTVLGHGSGLESPGWQEFRRQARATNTAFLTLLGTTADLQQLYADDASAPLYQLAEALIGLDEDISRWRADHYTLATRLLGDHAHGTQGTPVDMLARSVSHRFFPRLWDVRVLLTAAAPQVRSGKARP